MEIITTTQALRGLCDALKNDPYVTVDTEFMREKTYWSILCLIQIAGTGREAIIDPLADGLSLEPLYDLLDDENVLKVFHAARQDIEIFHHATGRVPKPLFDTQVAAMVCGLGDQVGYEALVRKLADAQIDKSSRFTDWSRRPLSRKQLDYALSDVTHLRVVYEKLQAQLDRTGRAGWIKEEMAVISASETYQADPLQAYKRIKFRPRKRRHLGVLMELAEWREREAQAQDKPRGRIVKDDALIEMAVQAPGDAAALGRMRAVPRGLANSRYGSAILSAVKKGMARPENTIPDINSGRKHVPEGAGAIAEILKLALKVVCERENIATRIVASAADIDAIAANQTAGVKALTGWRNEVFGHTALDLISGKLAIGLRDGKSTLIECPGQASVKAAE